MSSTSCPDATVLDTYCRNALDEQTMAFVDAHLESCSLCLQALDELLAADPLVRAMRGAHQAVAALPRGEGVDLLLDRLRAICTPHDSEGTGISNRWDTSNKHDARAALDETEPQQISRYRVLGKLGAGGMGTVYRAVDPELGREVAIKLPKWRAGGPDLVQRFLREARMGAGIRHPNVCTVHDVGELRGQPYVVMALIEGTSLAEHIKTHSLSPDQAVALTIKIAQGLDRIHQKGIIHRDLKPSNVLLDPDNEPVLTDFGLARPIDDDEHLTSSDTAVGTPSYMSVEQAGGATRQIGPPSDIYSLGVMLYQLLTKHLPFEGPSVINVLYQIRNETPLPPSMHAPHLDRQLESIVLKAMARDPAKRYPDASSLIKALKAWAAQQRNPKNKLARRQWIGVASFMFLAAGLLAFQLTTWPSGPDSQVADLVGLERHQEVDVSKSDENASLVLPKKESESKKQKVVPSPDTLNLNLFFNAAPSPLDALDAKQIWKTERFDWQPKELVAVVGSHEHGHWGQVDCMAYSPDGKFIVSGGQDGCVRVWKPIRSKGAFDVIDVLKLPGAGGVLWSIAFRHDGKGIAVAAQSGVCYLCNFLEGRLRLAEKLASDTKCMRALAFSPDDKILAGGWEKSKTIRLWHLTEQNRSAHLLTTESPGIVSLAFSIGGKLAAAGTDNTYHLWDNPGSGTTPRAVVHEPAAVTSIVFCSDGITLGTITGGRVCLWDIQEKNPRKWKQTEQNTFRCLTAATGKNILVTGPFFPSPEAPPCIWLWKVGVETVSEMHPYGVCSDLSSLTIAADGANFAFGRCQGLLEARVAPDLWPARSVGGGVEGSWYGDYVNGRLAFAPDSSLLVGGDQSGQLVFWEMKAIPKMKQRIGGRYSSSACGSTIVFSPCGRWLVSEGRKTASLNLWTPDGPDDRKPLMLSIPGAKSAACAAFSADGSVLAGSGDSRKIAIWDMPVPKEKFFVDTGEFIPGMNRLALVADGSLLCACGTDDSDVRIWDIRFDKPGKAQLLRHPGPVRCLACSPKGKILACGGTRFVWLWDLDGTMPKVIAKLPGDIATNSVAFSPSGDWLLTADHSGALTIWDTMNTTKIWHRELLGPIHKAIFAPDSRYIATLNGNGTIYVVRLSAS